MRSLKIAVVNQTAGGGATVAARAIEAWAEEGGWEARYFPDEGWPSGPREAGRALERALAEDPPDVVHAHCWYNSYPLDLMVRLGRRHPTAITLHDPFLVNQYGVACWECYRNPLCYACPDLSVARRFRPNYRMRDRLTKWWHNRRLRAELVFPSEWMRRRTARSELRRRPGRVIPYGIDLGRWRRERGLEPADSRTVLFAGNMYAAGDARKGLAVLLAAWPRVTSEVPEARLRLAGRLWHDGLPPGVEELGSLPPGELRDELEAAAIYCLPSLGDNSPLSVLEAMALEVCVVASAVGGIPEQLGQDEAGRLVPPADPTRLAAALVALLRDPILRSRMGRRGRERVQERFSWSRAREAHRTLYEDLAGRGASRPRPLSSRSTQQ